MPTLDHQDVQKMRDLVAVSKAYAHDKFESARRPTIMRQWFNGNHYGKDMPIRWIPKRDRVIVNLSQANVIGKVSRLAFRNPTIQVEALDDKSRELAEREQQYIEFKWRQINGLRALRLALFDTKIVGTGAVATGWSARAADQGSATQVVEDPDSLQFDVDRPVVRCVRPDGLILDPDSPEDVQKGWWCGEQLVIPLSRMKKMKRYAHVADRLTGVSDLPEGWWAAAKGQSPGDDDHLRGVAIQVVYLAESRQRIELCEEIPDEPLHVGDLPGVDYPQDDDGMPYFPYVLLRNIPDYNGVRGGSTHFGISDIEVTETAQIEINTDRSLKARHRRMDAAQFLARKGALDDAAKAILAEGKYKAVIEVEAAPSEDLSKILVPLAKATISPEVYTTEQDARRDMSELTRTASFERGTPTQGVEFATEAAMMQQGAEAGRAWEQQDFEQFAADVIEQVSYLLHRWGDTADLVEAPDQLEPEPMSGIELAGRYEHTIEPESMNLPDQVEAEAKAYGRVQGILPFVEMGADPKPLLVDWLESFDAANIEETMAGFDHLAQMKQQLQQAAQMIAGLQQQVGEQGAVLQGAMQGQGQGQGAE